MEKPINTIEDLIANSSFVRWVQGSEDADSRYWEQWLEEHPEKKQLLEDAALLVRGISFRKQQLSDAEIDQAWKSLAVSLQPEHHRSRKLFGSWHGIAAVLALLLSCALGVWFLGQFQDVEHQTGYGEIQKLTLPDGSRVTLNANSFLSYSRSAMKSQQRLLHLKGEAFFEVVKKTGTQPASFVVMTDHGRIEVLGTKFNVNSRRGKTQVVLNTGKVDFTTADEQYTSLEPGDMVEYDTKREALTMEKVNPEQHISWREQKLLFDDTSLQEVAHMLEDNFGLQVVIENPELEERKISGEVSTQNVEVILTAISKLLNITVNRSGNIVYFS